MTELPSETPRKITDDPYGAAILIRRLVAEQGLAYWRRYLLAFVLMGVAAATTAGSAYLLGEVINKAYVDKDVRGIAILSLVTIVIFTLKGAATYGHTVILSQIGNAILANNQRAAVRQADERKHRLLFRAAFLGISGAADRRRHLGDAGPQSPDQRDRTRSAVADRARRRHGDDGSVSWRCSASRWRRRRCWCCASW